MQNPLPNRKMTPHGTLSTAYFQDSIGEGSSLISAMKRLNDANKFSSIACADPESFVRGGPNLISFFS